MLDNIIRKGKQGGTQVFSLTFSGSREGQGSFPSPSSTLGLGAGRHTAPRAPPLAEAAERGLPVLRAHLQTPATLLSRSPRLQQTFCIEKIPAHLVSCLLLLASARTIRGIKRHALMDRRDEKKRTKKEK